MKALFRRHPLTLFFVLAFLLSWYPWILALIQRRTTGPNPLGPFVAGIIVTAIVYGRTGLREYFSRLVRWRVGLRWYFVTLGLPVAICFGAAAITFACSQNSFVSTLSAEKIREIPDRFIFILLFVGLGEEPGWRGFALPELQKRFSPLRSSLALAPIWSLWHLPLIGNEFPWPIVPAFLVSVFGATFMQTWLFNRTNGSVLLPMLFHATVNAVGAGLVFSIFGGPALIFLWWTYSLLWLGLGILLLICDRRMRSLARSGFQAAPA
jgi:membrane protease YdiL (CAAX protease family)